MLGLVSVPKCSVESKVRIHIHVKNKGEPLQLWKPLLYSLKFLAALTSRGRAESDGTDISTGLASNLVTDGAPGPRASSSVPFGRLLRSSRALFAFPPPASLAVPPQQSPWMVSLILSPLYGPG